MTKSTGTNAQFKKCYMYVFTVDDFYMQMTQDCTETFLYITICSNFVIPSAKQA